MRIPRLYSPTPLLDNAQHVLEEQAAHYLTRVLRRAPGDPLVLFDGSGGEFPASIVAVQRQRVALQLGARQAVERESPLRCHLGLGMSRGERMDWAIQKATELGVASITPLQTEHCELKLGGERAHKKRAHWQLIAISACEQCGRNRIPEVAAITALADWLDAVDTELALVCTAAGAPCSGFGAAAPASVTVLIGPEGGLSEPEVTRAMQRDFAALTLGPRILRTETAPVVALSLLQALWGDLGTGC